MFLTFGILVLSSMLLVFIINFNELSPIHILPSLAFFLNGAAKVTIYFFTPNFF